MPQPNPDVMLCPCCGWATNKLAGECDGCGFVWPVFGGWWFFRFAAMRVPVPLSRKYAVTYVPDSPPQKRGQNRNRRRRRRR